MTQTHSPIQRVPVTHQGALTINDDSQNVDEKLAGGTGSSGSEDPLRGTNQIKALKDEIEKLKLLNTSYEEKT